MVMYVSGGKWERERKRERGRVVCDARRKVELFNGQTSSNTRGKNY